VVAAGVHGAQELDTAAGVVHVGLGGLAAVPPATVGPLPVGHPISHALHELRRLPARGERSARHRGVEDVLRGDERHPAVGTAGAGHRCHPAGHERALCLEGAQGVQSDQMREDVALPHPGGRRGGEPAHQERLVNRVGPAVGVVVQDVARTQHQFGPGRQPSVLDARSVIEGDQAEQREHRPQQPLFTLPGAMLKGPTEGFRPPYVCTPERRLAQNPAAFVIRPHLPHIRDHFIPYIRQRPLRPEQFRQQRRLWDPACARTLDGTIGPHPFGNAPRKPTAAPLGHARHHSPTTRPAGPPTRRESVMTQAQCVSTPLSAFHSIEGATRLAPARTSGPRCAAAPVVWSAALRVQPPAPAAELWVAAPGSRGRLRARGTERTVATRPTSLRRWLFAPAPSTTETATAQHVPGILVSSGNFTDARPSRARFELFVRLRNAGCAQRSRR
jgi:hypothetical protein